MLSNLKRIAKERELMRAGKLKDDDGKNVAAKALGSLGGSANTPAQNAARAKNAKKGGWPKGRKRKVK